MAGKLYGIGVGPGDPELMTLKALRLIRECDVMVVPGDRYEESMAYRIAVRAEPDLADKEILAVSMPMTKDKDVLERAYRTAAEAVIRLLRAGKQVGFLTIGDVAIYSTYLYVHRLVDEAGYETEMVSGVPSFCAAAARLGVGLGERDQEIHILPASYQIEDGLSLPGTKILMKAGAQMGRVKELIRSRNMDAAMVERCGMEGERISLSVDEIGENAGYYCLVIVRDRKEG